MKKWFLITRIKQSQTEIVLSNITDLKMPNEKAIGQAISEFG